MGRIFIKQTQLCKQTYGIFLASKTRTDLWAYGQYLMLNNVSLFLSIFGHSQELSRCFDHLAIVESVKQLVVVPAADNFAE